LFSQRVGEGSDVVRVGKSLAWLNSKKVKEAKGLEKGSSGKVLKEEKQKRN
jgi:21S rRNA (GM2251-2'-O)-methyltransferase